MESQDIKIEIVESNDNLDQTFGAEKLSAGNSIKTNLGLEKISSQNTIKTNQNEFKKYEYETQLEYILRLNSKALNCMNSDNLKQGLKILNQCESQMDSHSLSEIEMLKAKSVTQNNQACIQRQLNKPNMAYLKLLQTLECEIKYKDPQQICSTQSNISTTLSSLSKHEEALKYSKISLFLFEKMSNENNTEEIQAISCNIDKVIQDKRDLYSKFYGDNEFRNSQYGKKPINIDKNVLIEKIDNKLKILSPKTVPKTKENARALMTIFNNLAVQQEQTGRFKQAIEYYYKGYIVSKQKLGINDPMTKKMSDIIENLAFNNSVKFEKLFDNKISEKDELSNDQIMPKHNIDDTQQINFKQIDMEYVYKMISDDLIKLETNLSNKNFIKTNKLKKLKVSSSKLDYQNRKDKSINKLAIRYGSRDINNEKIIKKQNHIDINHDKQQDFDKWNDSVIINYDESLRNRNRSLLDGHQSETRSKSVQPNKYQSKSIDKPYNYKDQKFNQNTNSRYNYPKISSQIQSPKTRAKQNKLRQELDLQKSFQKTPDSLIFVNKNLINEEVSSINDNTNVQKAIMNAQ